MPAAPDYAPPTTTTQTAKATAAGAAYTQYALTFPAGGNAYVLVPDRAEPWTHTAMLYTVHGMVGDREFTYSDGPVLSITEAALDRGWIVASSSHGNSWGNRRAMTDLQNTYGWAARRWWIDHTMMYGHSMGGMAVTVAAGQKIVPDLAGVVTLNAMLDVYDYRADSTLSAYGASSWEDLPGKIVGHDPMSDPADRWRDMPMLIIDTPGDTSLRQSDRFIARSVTPEKITHITGSHGHNQNPFIAETNAWFAAIAPAYAEGQAVGDQPVPKWDGWDAGPDPAPGPSGSGVYWTDGREASLYRADGSLVRLSRT